MKKEVMVKTKKLIQRIFIMMFMQRHFVLQLTGIYAIAFLFFYTTILLQPFIVISNSFYVVILLQINCAKMCFHYFRLYYQIDVKYLLIISNYILSIFYKYYLHENLKIHQQGLFLNPFYVYRQDNICAELLQRLSLQHLFKRI